MLETIRDLILHFKDATGISLLATLFTTLVIIFAFKQIGVRNLFLRDEDNIHNFRIKQLESRLNHLNKILNGPKDDGVVGLIDSINKIQGRLSHIENNEIGKNIRARVEKDVNASIEECVAKVLSNKDTLDLLINRSISNIIKESTEINLLNNTSLENLILEEELEKQRKNEDGFVELIDGEYKKTLKIREVVLNLFVVVNLFLLLAFFVSLLTGIGLTSLPLELSLSVSMLYFGFAAFTVYSIKFSNARMLTLIALKEDRSKERLITKYLGMVSGKEQLSEHDIALLKILTTNRAQREQKTEHPYEMILHGISNSNIQFKGGKFEVSKNNSDK